MKVCPVCNGLFDYIVLCPSCNEVMKICDRIENYYGSYSPYVEYEITDMVDGTQRGVCSHVCFCPKCNEKKIVYITEIDT